MPFDTFDTWTQDETAATLEPGRFLELGEYEPGGEMVARVHRDRRWMDGDLRSARSDPWACPPEGFEASRDRAILQHEDS